ncbi:Protein PIN-LIKES 3 [Glycine soja]|uniref:Protein PIN-LIKES 3 n=1 Tax=Glycine soja TaxID=3848 RepID=A0A445KFV7_GLYSO|nr:Protein PIN-LIKES 3 [Glycine soja]
MSPITLESTTRWYPLFQYVLVMQYAMPPAMNISTMAQLFEVGNEERSVILLWTYSAAAIALTAWLTFLLWLFLKVSSVPGFTASEAIRILFQKKENSSKDQLFYAEPYIMAVWLTILYRNSLSPLLF